MSRAAWTSEAPTEPGIYEWRHDARQGVGRVRVLRPAPGNTFVDGLTPCLAIEPPNPDTIYFLRGEWRGPLGGSND